AGTKSLGTFGTGLRLDVATDAGFTNIVSGYQNLDVAASKAILGLPAGIAYYYRLRAYNSGGISGYSNTVQAFVSVLLGSQNYTTPGSFSYTLPANTNRVVVCTW